MSGELQFPLGNWEQRGEHLAVSIVPTPIPPRVWKTALLIAAIDTGMRSGEMLALRFADIDLERGLITLRGETTKSRKTRLVPTRRRGCVTCWRGCG